MKIVKTIDVAGKITDKIICNMCGGEIPKDNYGNFVDYLDVDKRWGYNSPYDNAVHKFDLCEKCYTEIISRFEIDVGEGEKQNQR